MEMSELNPWQIKKMTHKSVLKLLLSKNVMEMVMEITSQHSLM